MVRTGQKSATFPSPLELAQPRAGVRGKAETRCVASLLIYFLAVNLWPEFSPLILALEGLCCPVLLFHCQRVLYSPLTYLLTLLSSSSAGSAVRWRQTRTGPPDILPSHCEIFLSANLEDLCALSNSLLSSRLITSHYDKHREYRPVCREDGFLIFS